MEILYELLKKIKYLQYQEYSITCGLNFRINGPRYNVKKDYLCELKYITIHIINNTYFILCI